MSDPPPPAAPRGHLRAAVACLVAGLALAHRPLFAGRVVGMRDMTRWVHPAQWRVRDALAHAHLPRWNALEGLGFPTLADPLYAVFYPPMLLTHVFAPLVAITVVWWLHLVLAAVGIFTLARRHGRSVEAATLAGFAYALSGPMASEWTLGMRLPGYAWLPWMAVGAWDLVVRRDRSAAAVARAALPVGLALLAGEAFVVFFAVGVATVIALAAAPPRPWAALARWSAAV
ncbi:MAG: hypothetical protein JWM10_5474, partial [Myxococcaceae bacterium]|nr:hypothetical protein [Myxococcaceae bacterium]